jgi:hypothetical protein
MTAPVSFREKVRTAGGSPIGYAVTLARGRMQFDQQNGASSNHHPLESDAAYPELGDLDLASSQLVSEQHSALRIDRSAD